MRAPKLFDRRKAAREEQPDRRAHKARVPDAFCTALAEALLVQLRDGPYDLSAPFRTDPLWKQLVRTMGVREIDAIAASGALLGEGFAKQSGQGMYEMTLTERGHRALQSASCETLQRLLAASRASSA